MKNFSVSRFGGQVSDDFAIEVRDVNILSERGPGARFSKVPKRLVRISGNMFSLYLQNEGVSRHETILFLFPLQHMKRPALQDSRVGVLRMAFRDFRETSPTWAELKREWMWKRDCT